MFSPSEFQTHRWLPFSSTTARPDSLLDVFFAISVLIPEEDHD
jgi:hypothetical protein